ncbi:MAG: nucleoside kinase [Clostridiaceae bacterium]|nr:nucleoside kinase [Clostridiaceae bacterium]MDY5889035.1 nucleoside kinase [Oscillospiraceae bacterium]
MAYFTLNNINENVESNMESFINDAESRFESSVTELADRFTSDCDIVLLAGPSSSGKTTTAGKIAQKIKNSGRNAYTLSLDDYYRNAADIPLTEKGLKDFENVSALDIDLIHHTFSDLIEKRTAQVPEFDFVSGTRKPETRKLELKKDDLIIVEGIHALNPIITKGLDESHITKVYISVSSRVTEDSGRVVFSKRNLRLVRRMIRDYHYRNTSVEKTLSQWQEVLKGEDKYIFPFERNASFRIDSFHPYEPCLFKSEAVELLGTVGEDSNVYPIASELKNSFSELDTIDMSKLPADSLLREFV